MAFPFNRREPGFWLSGIAHAALLTAGIMAFAAETLPEPEEGIPVEILTDSPTNEITRGVTNAEAPQEKPRVDRQADVAEERDPGEAPTNAPAPPTRPVEMKTADREVEPPPESNATAEPAPMPPSRPDFAKAEAEAAKAEAAAKAAATAKAAEAREAAVKAAAKAKADAAAKAEAVKLAQLEEAREKAAEERAQKEEEAKARAAAKAKADAAKKAREDAEAKAALERKLAEAQAKAEADAKAKTEAAAKAKAEAAARAAEQRRKLAEARAAKAKAEAEARARRQAEAAERFNPGDISRVLQARAPSQSAGSTSREVQRTASLGTRTGNSPKLNPNQLAQLRSQIMDQLLRCWQVPITAQTAAKAPTAQIKIGLHADGSLAIEPALLSSSRDPLFQAVADSALRAVRRCAPLDIPSRFAPYYDEWKTLNVTFDPREVG